MNDVYEIHLWCSREDVFGPKSRRLKTKMLIFESEAEDAIKRKQHRIDTICPHAIYGSLLVDGYRIFVHPADGSDFEITLGACDRTDREIKPAHNLGHMLVSGAFGDIWM